MLEGLPPNNATHRLSIVCDEANARAIANIIFEMFDPADVAASAFEDPEGANDGRVLSWTVEAYFADAPDAEWLMGLIAETASPEIAAKAIFDRIEQKDWVKASLDGLQPVRAGRFLVFGSHDRNRVRPNDIGLEIEAALAFGTGHHGTTRGCLLMLDGILKQRRPRNILDVGTGTGVLALAAARYLHQIVAAGDIDPVSCEATRENARLNGARPWLHPVVATGVRHPALQARAPYNVILANILAKPLRGLAPALARLAAPGADIILSGLLLRDVPGILSVYRVQGLTLVRRIEIDGWATLHLRQGGVAARPVRFEVDFD